MADTVAALPYPLVYVRAPYFADAQVSEWPDTVRPLSPDAGSQLVLLHPNGVREVLFPLERYRSQLDTPAGSSLAVGAVADPNVSFDARRVLFTWYHDAASTNPQRDGLSWRGADLYVLDLASRELTRLTHQEHTPNTGNGARFDAGDAQSNHPRIGVFNTGGAWAPGGQIVFTSSRNNLLPPKAFSWGQRVLQLFRMDADGRNVEQIGHLNLGMALHPLVLRDGRILFSSWEMHGLRDARNFPLWVIGPDGRGWNGVSGFSEIAITHHFATEMPGGDVVVCRYYNLNNNGFGDLVRFPLDPPGPDFATPDPPAGSDQIPFERIDQQRLTPFTTPEDFPAPCPGFENHPYGSSADPDLCPGAARRGKLTHPAATPNAVGSPAADLLAVYSPGPANHNGIYLGTGSAYPLYHGEIVLLPDGAAIPVPPPGVAGRPPELVTVVAEDGYNLAWPRPVVRYQDLHGQAEPAAWPALTAATIAAEGLVPGEPFGLVGSSSLLWRDTAPAIAQPWLPDRDPFNFSRESLYGWLHQGADAGVYADDDIYAVRVLAQQAQTDRSYPNNGARFEVLGGERMRILGEVPVRGAWSGKTGDPQVQHPDGNWAADTSFLVQIPADVSFTFQTLDRRGMVLNMAQTWHQVRPGEARYDCGGCHAHSKTPLAFAGTAASEPGYAPRDLARSTPLLTWDDGAPGLEVVASPTVGVDYARDVAPILRQRCASCHGANQPAAGLVLDPDAPWVQGMPRPYRQLVADTAGFLEPQLTRWVRGFQSRQSLLVWKLWGERLDGRSNGDRGDDLDFTGSTAHPNGVGVPGMPASEKLTIQRWIDLGVGIDWTLLGEGSFWGYFEDDLRPTLVVTAETDDGSAAGALLAWRVAAFDVVSGVAPASLEVVADAPLGPFPAGSNLAAGLAIDPQGHLRRVALPRPVTAAEAITFRIRVRDHAGHLTELVRTHRAGQDVGELHRDGFELGTLGNWDG